MIKTGYIIKDLDEIKFKLDEQNVNQPTSFGIEFYNKNKTYYYTLTFDDDIILNESLFESNTKNDILIFERTFENEKQKINFGEEYIKIPKNKLFVEILEERLLQKNELLLSFIHSKYESEFSDVSSAFDWFDNVLIIIKPNAKPGPLAHLLDVDTNLKDFAYGFLPTLGIGIYDIGIKKQKFKEFAEGAEFDIVNDIIADLKEHPKQISLLRNGEGEEIALVNEGKEIFAKKILVTHLSNFGKRVDFSLAIESDGTKRIMDYLPAFNGIINTNKVYIIDEIERSIHPITIKEILRKIALEEIKGQLIFTTHESCLLDQEIFRPDEIWFAQKDVDGATKLYSLSNYKIHHTANIENGYLNGRYGGIPFVSNLKDLNWHKYELSK